jgi:hypothetical protein
MNPDNQMKLVPDPGCPLDTLYVISPRRRERWGLKGWGGVEEVWERVPDPKQAKGGA